MSESSTIMIGARIENQSRWISKRKLFSEIFLGQDETCSLEKFGVEKFEGYFLKTTSVKNLEDAQSVATKMRSMSICDLIPKKSVENIRHATT